MNSVASGPALIGLDWGTTSFRAYLIGSDGDVLDRLSAPQGIRQVEGGDFDAAFARLLGPWLDRHAMPVVASGMITSRNGWVETPYMPLPGGAAELAQALVPHRCSGGQIIHFVTGMATHTDGAPDVMRGEETQIVGAVAGGRRDGVFVLPGTHSKWVKVRAGRIISYATFMTGEVFAALCGHTILGALMRQGGGDRDFDALLQGIAVVRRSGLGLLHSLFTARTLPLFEQISPEDTSDYLSGLLIGTELMGAVQFAPDLQEAMVLGRGDLAGRYAAALDAFGIKALTTEDGIVARGHYAIAKAGGLLP